MGLREMNEMIDRAVRALEFLPYSATDEEKVRAVLVAIREPTKEMIVQGAMAGELYGNTDAEASWQAMIDEALK